MVRPVIAALLLSLGACAVPGPPIDSPAACALDHVVDLPVRFEHNWPIVSATMDGVELRWVVDTGADVSLLGEAAARRIGAQSDWNQPQGIVGTTGYLVMHPAKGRLELGSEVRNGQSYMITPVDLSFGADGPVDGLIGGDVLSDYDVDLNLPQARIALYRPRLCPGTPPPVLQRLTALTTPPSWLPTGKRPQIAASLDGHPYVATLDTGAQSTSVTRITARAVGITAEMLAHDRPVPSLGVTPGTRTARLHRFARLTFGPFRANAPLLKVTERLDDGDGGLLGSDYLRNHRIWISYASQKLFMSNPVAPRPATPPAAPPP